MRICPLLLSATGLLLTACHNDQPAEKPLPTGPLLDAVPTGYRPTDRQDTLESYYAPYEAYEDSTFQLDTTYRSLALVRVRFVSASTLRRTHLDTLTFRHLHTELGFDNQTGYFWDLTPQPNRADSLAEGADGTPLKLFSTYTVRLILTEYRRRRNTGVAYDRNSYLMDYPFQPVSVAKVSDSVLYVRAFLYRARVPQPSVVYPDYPSSRPQRRIPHVADQPDTTRLATLRFSFRQLHRSADDD
ncbi:hypothetical protein [Hymenobacter cellulosivorans]|uniref:DUF4270 family protein n=1 Tax=Hymenobacter cellulosivorans TaxID=2932249 RepID=A0ABY4FBL0_9BACT|nr:hypothetical protein [Hymenobacter cellulosivorans]UOQ53403.1 hypothetical protein MUN80_01280 [Hymenobacter cellulosivorans]